MTIDSKTESNGKFAQLIQVGKHALRADMPEADGGEDSGPGSHDYFDTALIACKTLTATWFAKKKGIALERVEGHVERDASAEREGKYVLKVRLAYFGPLSDDDKKRIHAAVERCPVHKLMTTTEIVIETAPLESAS